MKPTAAKLLAAVLAVCLVASTDAVAASGKLTAAAGDAWRADWAFAIEWDPVAPVDPTRAVYRLYDSQGGVVAAFDRPLGQMLNDVFVPPIPDLYTLEAWLVNESGGSGPHSTAALRFDNAAPPPPGLEAPNRWVVGTEATAVHIDRPSEPLPLSGIGGYAISVDRGGGAPCAQTGRCLASEIDLAEAAGGAISLGTLPEGVNVVRAVAVSGTGVPSQVATAAVRVDGSAPSLRLDGAPAGWSSRPVLMTARAVDSLSGMAAAGAGGPFTAISVDGAPPGRSAGDSVSTWIGGSGTHLVASFARDAAGNQGNAATTVRIDEEPPRVAFAAAQDPAEPERIEAIVSDRLSGPSADRGSIGIRLAGTRARFETLPTRNSGERLIAHWDSDSHPPGKYELLATGLDAAGNAAVGGDRTRGGRMVLVNPLKAQVELKAGLSRLRLTGRLRRFDGSPVGGQAVVVTETFATGSAPRQRTTAVGTDRRGAFSLSLRPGPSRDVVARFAGTTLLSRAASKGLHLDAATKVSLRSSSASARVGGEPIVFSGRVARRGAGASAVDGLPVELQFRFRGGAWSEFRTVEADAHGRFRYPYRFSDDDSRGVRFQFRAYVKGREGWPYGPGTSRPVSVTGR